ncbi:Uncharacterized protein APZ42_027759 [Daphnia magna]|uniref:Uncharacterized protein n=1 Tax=Daphnia magna TaxID=35525 RepID=A0A164R2M2_9CRUS|nr:Uncharacterized protein APZ42_027759 [Daphnia magna]
MMMSGVILLVCLVQTLSIDRNAICCLTYYDPRWTISHTAPTVGVEKSNRTHHF